MLHTANEIIELADVLALNEDGSYTLTSAGVPCGIVNASGRSVDQSQLRTSESTHVVTMHYADASAVKPSSYLRIDGTVFIVDAPPIDPRKPRPRTWLEIYCHMVRTD